MNPWGTVVLESWERGGLERECSQFLRGWENEMSLGRDRTRFRVYMFMILKKITAL